MHLVEILAEIHVLEILADHYFCVNIKGDRGHFDILHSDINAPKDELEQNFFVLDENFHTVFWGWGEVEESLVKTLIWNFLGFSKIIPSKFVRITIYLVFSPSGTLWLDSPVMVTGTKIFRGQSVLPPFIQQYLLELLK